MLYGPHICLKFFICVCFIYISLISKKSISLKINIKIDHRSDMAHRL